tara:strand:- start:1671 stop:2096 length:426 start_codon:yes stop_codon:yes gene_type:complete
MATRDYIKPNSSKVVVKNEFTDLDIMFTAHPISGDITTKKDSDAVMRSVRNILLTNNYERPFKPNFGADLRSQLFNLQGLGSRKRLKRKIMVALTSLEPRITNIRIQFGKVGNNTMDIGVFYTIIKTGRNQEQVVKVSRVR